MKKIERGITATLLAPSFKTCRGKDTFSHMKLGTKKELAHVLRLSLQILGVAAKTIGAILLMASLVVLSGVARGISIP